MAEAKAESNNEVEGQVDERSKRQLTLKYTVLKLLFDIHKKTNDRSANSKISISKLNNEFLSNYQACKFQSLKFGKLKEFVQETCHLEVEKDSKGTDVILVKKQDICDEIKRLEDLGYHALTTETAPFSKRGPKQNQNQLVFSGQLATDKTVGLATEAKKVAVSMKTKEEIKQHPPPRFDNEE